MLKELCEALFGKEEYSTIMIEQAKKDPYGTTFMPGIFWSSAYTVKNSDIIASENNPNIAPNQDNSMFIDPSVKFVFQSCCVILAGAICYSTFFDDNNPHST